MNGHMLDGGLLLRAMRVADRDDVAAFVTRAFAFSDGEPDLTAGAWAHDLLRGDHPTSSPGDGTVVVDPASGRIVSCCFLISQTWTYEGIPFDVGRPELIATDPEFRNRGLVRAQLANVHARSRELGHRMQALTGIPYFYRQFGYETAPIIESGRSGALKEVPDSPTGRFRLRPAVEADLPFITRMYAQAASRAAIAAVRDEGIWRDELLRRNPESDYWHELRIVETGAGASVGFVAFARQMWGETLSCTICELVEPALWDEVAPWLLGELRAAGLAGSAASGEAFRRISMDWTPQHPFVQAAPGFFTRAEPAFAWYSRIDDLPGFVRHVAPVLERRLAVSEAAGYSGDLLFGFYGPGLRLRFAAGRLVEVEGMAGIGFREADARFPGTTFLQLLLGSRSLVELERAFPGEAAARGDEVRAVVEAIFPKVASAVWPVA